MKILVIGREGQVARSLAEAAARSGAAIVACGRPECDLRDVALLDAAIAKHRPDAVINAAAYTRVDQAESDEAAAFAVNAEGVANVARACAAHGVPLIHLSTDYVFDGTKSSPYVEEDAANPASAYGRSKLAGERAVQELCERHLIVRTAWVFSPFGQNFLRTMLRLAQTRPAISVVSDQVGCPTYAPHLAEALLAMARAISEASFQGAWGIYHVAGQGETDWSDFAREIFAQAESRDLPSASVTPIPSSDYPTAATRPANSRLNCAKLATTFGISLPGWRDGVRACVARIAADRAAAA